jgi:hypothetical protein
MSCHDIVLLDGSGSYYPRLDPDIKNHGPSGTTAPTPSLPLQQTGHIGRIPSHVLHRRTVRTQFSVSAFIGGYRGAYVYPPPVPPLHLTSTSLFFFAHGRMSLFRISSYCSTGSSSNGQPYCADSHRRLHWVGFTDGGDGSCSYVHTNSGLWRRNVYPLFLICCPRALGIRWRTWWLALSSARRRHDKVRLDEPLAEAGTTSLQIFFGGKP